MSAQILEPLTPAPQAPKLQQLQKLRIRLIGANVLQQKALPVKEVLHPTTQTFIDRMIITCQEEGSMGLSASQVGVPMELFIIAPKPNAWYPDALEEVPLIVINPVITWSSPEMEDGPEDCLSIPGKRAIVSRHKSIIVQFTNRKNQVDTMQLVGLEARIFQRQYDLTQGVLFISKANGGKVYDEKGFDEIVNKLRRGA